VTMHVSTLMLVRKIDTVFVHHGYPHPLTHQLSHRICTDLKIDPGEGWGATAPACPPRGDATANMRIKSVSSLIKIFVT